MSPEEERANGKSGEWEEDGCLEMSFSSHTFQTIFKALPSIMRFFFSNITPVALITQHRQTTEPTQNQQRSPVKVLTSVQVEISSLCLPHKSFKID